MKQQRPKNAAEDDQQCMTVLVDINGISAQALVDSGSTTTCISPAFADVAHVKRHVLDNPITLQLGCVGSRSKINHGVTTDIRIANTTHGAYFDVVNLDHYNMVLGIPSMKGQDVTIDFAKEIVRVKDRVVPTHRGEGDKAPTAERKGVVKVVQTGTPRSEATKGTAKTTPE